MTIIKIIIILKVLLTKCMYEDPLRNKYPINIFKVQLNSSKLLTLLKCIIKKLKIFKLIKVQSD